MLELQSTQARQVNTGPQGRGQEKGKGGFHPSEMNNGPGRHRRAHFAAFALSTDPDRRQMKR
jgi:hypothetical protein